MTDRETTQKLVAAVHARFCAPEWACFSEVGTVGFGYPSGSADAVAVNLYPSRGLRVHGVEIKASRADWLRELKAPAKAETFVRHCDHWWIATVPGVVQPGELPPTWGMLEIRGRGRLWQVKAAPLLKPVPLDRGFMASLLRRASQMVEKQLQARMAEQLKVERDRIDGTVKERVRRETQEFYALQQAVNAFEEVSGVKITAYNGDDIGEAVRIVRSLPLTNQWRGIKQLAKDARSFADAVEKTLGEPIGQTVRDLG